MNVLLIAPDNPTLPLAEAEVRAVSAQLRPYALRGAVRRTDVLDAIVSQAWDVLWFATHGDANGIMLSSDYLSTAELVAQVRASGARLIVLNTCSSEAIGRELFHETGCAVITTLTQIGDTTAYQTGVLLARNLAAGLAIEDAFEQSRPGGNLIYRLFGDQTSKKKH